MAELNGRWVGLAAFSAAALHLKGREQQIEWSPRRRSRRLPFVVNNGRCLMLPAQERYPNLASRVLGLCRRRLCADWQTRWGDPVLVVERFMEEHRCLGTCLGRSASREHTRSGL